MFRPVPFLAALVLPLFLVPAAFADDDGTGKTVLLKRLKNVRIASTEADGKAVELKGAVYLVHKEQDGRLLVRENGVEGWLAKDDAVTLEEAIPYFTGRIQTNRSDASAYAGRGWARQWNAELDDALGDFSEAIRLDPKSPMSYVGRGCVWTDKKNYDRAIKDFDEAIRLDAKNASTYLDRGLVWVYKRDADRAIKDFDMAIGLDPKNALAHYNRGRSWSDKKEFDQAFADYDKAIRLEPLFVDAYHNRAMIWLRKQDYDRAIQDFDKAIGIDPMPRTYRMRGYAWTRRKEYDRAIADYDESIRLEPKDADTYRYRGDAWYIKQDYVRVVKDYEAAIRFDPNNSRAYLNLAWLLATCEQAKFRNGQRALELAKKACELDNYKKPDHINVLAAAFAEAGDFEQAMKYQRQALDSPEFAREQGKAARERLRLYEIRRPHREP